MIYLGFSCDSAVKNLPAMQEMQIQSRLGRSPEDGMATQSDILAWEIPRTEKPGGLQSMGSRVGHNLATEPPPPTVECNSTLKNNATRSNMDGPRDYHTKWSKSDRERHIIWYHA